MNIDFANLCGKHTAIYDAYYRQMDPKGSGMIGATVAAKFLKKSGLSDVVLSRVWDLSDPNGKGFLDKPGFFVALKLVALAQAGQVYNMNNIYMETEKPPKVGDLPKIVPPRMPPVPAVPAGAAPAGYWAISVIDRLKYEQLFESLKPVGGMLPGNKVRGVLLESKLPMDTLGKIWDLADQDQDGSLDKDEFIVAMHLVYKTLEKRTVPDVLPPELRKPLGSGGGAPPKPAPPVVGGAAMPRAPSGDGFGEGGFVANFPKDIAPPPAITIPPPVRVPPVGGPATMGPLISTDPLIPIGAPPSVTANADWVVSPEELQRFEVMFRDADRDKDGLVNGLEVKNVFLKSGVPQKMLAHIWALCDTNQSGKLTLEQFALAMWMVERKQKGIDPPQVLTANMVPPSMRGIVSGVDVQPQEQKPTYTNPELEMISKEIEELAKERRALETEIAQKEADIRIKNGEVRSLQSELDTLSATLKQLENQRGEAQKRLDDLKAQVNKIREQCQKQEETINEQEGELNTKRSELQKLKDEENSLQKEYEDNNRELQKLTNHLQNTQLQISSIRSMVTQLMETQRQMTDALLMCRAAIEAENVELVSEYQLKIEPDFDDAKKTLEKEIEIPKDDPFNEGTTAISNTANKNNGFATNGFDSDPFTSGFDAFGGSSNMGFGADAFANKTETTKSDPFAASNVDAFGADAFANKTESDINLDPFAALHAPTGQGQVLSPNTQSQSNALSANSKSGPPPRPESPSPALPPKKSKVPPPRPAPPRPMQAPNRPAQPDAFGSSGGPGGFADFADFDNKAPIIPPPLPTIPYKSVTTALKSKPSISNTHTNNSASTSISSSANSNLSLFDNFTLTPASTATSAVSDPAVPKTADDSFSDIFKDPKRVSNTTPAPISTTNTDTLTHMSTSSSSSTNPLNRSTTPMQLAANTAPAMSSVSVFDAFAALNNDNNNAAAAFNTNDNFNTLKSTSSIISGPTDFKDDPFKDYRYEDVFNIKDPFDDDDISTDPEKVFKDDLSSDDEKNRINNNNQALDTLRTTPTISSSMSNAFNSAKSHSTVSSDFLNQFESFTMNSNPSPVPSHHSSSSSAFTGLGAADSLPKSKSNTPIPSGNPKASNNNVFADGFADFDAFSTKSTTSSSGSHRKDANIAKEAFFDSFNDQFETNSVKSFDSAGNCKRTNAAKSTMSLDAFDAFGGATDVKARQSPFDAFGLVPEPIRKASPAAFDAFEDSNFDDDFFKNPRNISKNTNMNNNKTQTKSSLAFGDANDNFAKFDAFPGDNFSSNLNNSSNNNSQKHGTSKPLGGLKKVQNQTFLPAVPNAEKAALPADGVKLPEKFAGDYSKPETFDDDMQEAIKRSMIDQ